VADYDAMRAIFYLETEASKFEKGLKGAEQKAEESAERIATTFSKMGLAISTAISVVVVAALDRAITKTAELNTEMLHLSERMGMPVEKASELTAILQRFGVSSATAVRGMSELSQEVQISARAIDPLNTRIGRMIGSLKDANGNVLGLSEVLGKARDRVGAAGTEMEKLQVAQQIFGRYLGSQLLPALEGSTDQWRAFAKAAQDTGEVLTPQQAAMSLQFEQLRNSIHQAFTTLERDVGEAALPAINTVLKGVVEVVEAFAKFAKAHPTLVQTATILALVLAPLTAIVGVTALLSKGWTGLLSIMQAANLNVGALRENTERLREVMDALSLSTDRATAASAEHAAAMRVEGAVAATTAAESGAGAAGGVAKTAGGILGAVAIPVSVAIAGYTALASLADHQNTSITQLLWRAAEFYGIVRQGTAQMKQDAADLAKEKAARPDRPEGAGTPIRGLAQVEEEIPRFEALRKAREEAFKLGQSDREAQRAADEATIGVLAEQAKFYRDAATAAKQGSSEQAEAQAKAIQAENSIIKIRAEAAQASLQQEELSLRARGQLYLANEIQLLQQRLNDENITYEERLKAEADIFQKRRQYEEKLVEIAQQVGLAGPQQEIAFRTRRGQEALGRGDVPEAAQEFVKARQVALQYFDEQVEFEKRLRTVSLQDEIQFQAQKLQVVKGNAQEEMKILGQVADLDKQLTDQRIQFALNYTNRVRADYAELQKIQGGQGGDTFEQAAREQQFQQRDIYRQAGDVLRGGGTDQERDFAVKVAQEAIKENEDRTRLGRDIPTDLKDFISTANEIMKRATGSEPPRAPGEVSLAVGSLTSSTEGLATTNLARGSEVPRLDTSFTDLATRLRDVINSQAIPNIQAFANAVTAATKQITGTVPPGINAPAALGPGGETSQFGPASPEGSTGNGPGTVAQPGFGTVSFRGGPTVPVQAGGTTSGTQELTAAGQSIKDAVDLSRETTDELRATIDTLSGKIDALAAAVQTPAQVTVSVDPNSGVLTADLINNTTAKALRPF
jgi:hypothetical protein